MATHEQKRAAVVHSDAQERSELLKTRALVAAVIVGNVAGNTLLSRGLHQAGERLSTSPLHYLQAFADPWVIGGVLVLMAWMTSDLALLSRADLSYVLPVTAISYVLIAIIGHWVLHERISLTRWVGILVITLGVMLVGETPPATTPLHPPPEDEL